MECDIPKGKTMSIFVFGFKTSWDLILLAWEAASAPAQVAAAGLGIAAGTATVAVGGREALRGIANYQGGGAEVTLPDGSKATFSQVASGGGIECLREDGTIVTLRGDDAKAVIEADLTRDPAKRDEVRKRISEIKSKTYGTRSYAKLTEQDTEMTILGAAGKQLAGENTELKQDLVNSHAVLAKYGLAPSAPEAAETSAPEAAETSAPEAAETSAPEAAETSAPEAG
jgi:hypothetical protein